MAATAAATHCFIADGGKLISDWSVIGDYVSANFNSVTVSNAGSVWSNSVLIVGNDGSGNSLFIRDEAKVVTAGNVWIGANGASSANSVFVERDASWEIGCTLHIGRVGVGNDVFVNRASTITAGNVIVDRGGLNISPSAFVHVTGNYTQAVTGTLSLGIGEPDPLEYGRLIVDGNATLGGTLRLVPVIGYDPQTNHVQRIVETSGCVFGEFEAVSNLFVTALSPRLDYSDGYNVWVEWVLASFLKYAQTPNQRSVAAVIDGAADDSRLGDLLDYLVSIPTNALPGALDTIAPEELTALYQTAFAGLNTHGSRLRNRFLDLRAGRRGVNASRLALYELSAPGQSSARLAHSPTQPGGLLFDLAGAATANPWSLFIEGVGATATVGSDNNAKGYHLRSYGFSLGLDRQLSDACYAGLTAGYAADTANLTGPGRVTVDSFQAGLYGGCFGRHLYLAGYVGGSYHEFDTKRAGLDGNAKGDTEALGLQALLEAGCLWERGAWTVGVQGTLQYQTLRLNGFTEKGSLAPLQYGEQSEAALHSELGASLSYRIAAGRTVWTPTASVSWQHQYRDDALALGARFASGAGAGFVVEGPKTGRDSCVVGAGVTTQWSPRCGSYLRYETELGRQNY